MTIVVDASVVLSALIDGGDEGERAAALLRSNALAAPHLLPAEVTNVLRRSTRSGLVSPDVAAMAYADFAGLRIEFFAFAPFADRVWELRHTVTSYDAWYVALAEALGAPLATLDHRLIGANGPRCQFALAKPGHFRATDLGAGSTHRRVLGRRLARCPDGGLGRRRLRADQ